MFGVRLNYRRFLSVFPEDFSFYFFPCEKLNSLGPKNDNTGPQKQSRNPESSPYLFYILWGA